MRPSLILDVVGRASFHTILVFSLYLLFAGHNAPGGGFVGGLVGGAAFVLRYANRGAGGVRQASPLPWERVLGSGLLLSGVTGVAGWFVGGDFLESAALEVTLPLLGTVKATTALPFDAGVYLVVVGLELAALRTLGAEEPGRARDVRDSRAGSGARP